MREWLIEAAVRMDRYANVIARGLEEVQVWVRR